MSSAHGEFLGKRLGDFEIVREIGRGGMGVVYEARQVSLNRKVALKVLSGGFALSARAVERFQREAEAAAKLHHTNIVPVYATGADDGTHYYAMELIEGPSLDGAIKQMRAARRSSTTSAAGTGSSDTREAVPAWVENTLHYASVAPASTPNGGVHPAGLSHNSSTLDGQGHYFDTVARMVAEVADALDHAHKHGVIHRDVKPSNMLLAPDGRLAINDFGLARLLEQPGMTQTGEFVGTPAYMSPEQITAGRTPLDHRTDVYSLGATLYELLTLERPFAGESREQVLAQILHKEPRRPRKLNSRTPLDLETICLKALEKDPDRRYQSAGALAEDLRRYLDRFAILARRAGPAARLVKWVRRHPGVASALAAALIALILAAVLGYQLYQGEQQRRAEREEHERQLSEEKRRNALDKAVLAARQDDLEGAQQAIREAEKLGCSAGQIRMLRGQVALYNGNHKEAVEHLQQAVELLPRSVAAWSMLAVAHVNHGQPSEHTRALKEAMRLPAETPEDFLFRGHAECILDPRGGLRTLDEAVRRRPSVLARLIRVEALKMTLLDNPNPEQAEIAMDDVRSIKRQLPGNAMALTVSLSVNLACYFTFDEFKKPVQRQAALDEAWKDARALAAFPHLASAVATRWTFLNEVGREEDVLADLRHLAEKTRNDYAVYSYSISLQRHGRFEEAARILNAKNAPPLMHIMRIFALAELPDGVKKANDVCTELALQDLTGWDLFNAQQALRFLGRKDEAIAVCRRFLAQPERFPPAKHEAFRRTLEYGAGSSSAAELLRDLRGSRGDLSNAHLTIALTALADGKRDEAKKHFQLCIETRFFEYLPYDLARTLLIRMNDPAWPTWIPVKR